MCKCTNEKIPYFNAPIYLENKQQIGKVDEIFGPIRNFVSFQLFPVFENFHIQIFSFRIDGMIVQKLCSSYHSPCITFISLLMYSLRAL